MSYRHSAVNLLLISLLCAGPWGCRKQPGPTFGMERPQAEWIRVLLFGNLTECTLSSEGDLVITDEQTGSPVIFAGGRELTARLDTDGLMIGNRYFGPDVMIRTEKPNVFNVNGMEFRGYLQLLRGDDGKSIAAINHLPLESYLGGVIGAEMQSYWEPEALKAQAVASRTYCLYIKNRFGSGRAWDLRRNQAHQVYRGLEAETAPTLEAIRETAGQILVCRDDSGGLSIFPTYYSSACGGHTANSRDVFGDTHRPLEGVECPWCRTVTRGKLFYWSGFKVTLEEISQKLLERYPSLERLVAVEEVQVAKQTDDGRVTSVLLKGKDGQTARLRGEDFRLSIDPSGMKVKSTIFMLVRVKDGYVFRDGRGFGHGVGFCQSGGQGMARQNKTYEEILQYYYPASMLVHIQAEQ